MGQVSRIFMTADAVGGIWTYAMELAAGLNESGIEVTLCLLGPEPTSAQHAQAAAIPGLTVLQTDQPLDWMTDGLRAHWRVANAVAELAAESDADLIHLNSPSLAAGARFPVPLVGVSHSCLATWWDSVEGGPLPPSFEWQTAVLSAGYRNCHVLIAPSQSYAESIRKRYNVSVRPVRNGRSSRNQRRDSTREPIAMTAGRLWDKGKNFALLDAAAGLMRSPVEAAGPLIGPNRERAIAKNVSHLGVLDRSDLEARLRRAAVFVSLPRYEPFGLSVLEAAQAGCALVLSDIPTFRELWSGAACLVPPDDANAAAAAIDALLEDEGQRRRLAARSRRRASRYSAEAMLRGTLQAYEEALERSSRKERAA